MSFGLKEAARLHDQIRGAQIGAYGAASDPSVAPDIALRLKRLAKSLDSSVEQVLELLDAAVRRP